MADGLGLVGRRARRAGSGSADVVPESEQGATAEGDGFIGEADRASEEPKKPKKTVDGGRRSQRSWRTEEPKKYGNRRRRWMREASATALRKERGIG